ncbi:MAG: nucleotide exchange factor GrpE [Halobacteriota archaeon]|nr:nucleotide exchange factor GrpE [Halobacteriota archaeon]
MSKDEQNEKVNESEGGVDPYDIEVSEETGEEGLVEEYVSRIQYLQAEFENYKKIVSRERIEYERRANEALIKDLLPIIDSFENAISSARKNNDLKGLIEGVELIYGDLMDVLGERGLSPIEALKEKFDPYKHEAMMVVESDEFPENSVVEELQKGYTLNGNVIRTSKVKVSK